MFRKTARRFITPYYDSEFLGIPSVAQRLARTNPFHEELNDGEVSRKDYAGRSKVTG
jgi:hypothetical protein